MENHYHSPHLRRIWGTAISFFLPLPIMSLFYGFSDKALVMLFMVFLCSIDVYKAIFSSRTQTKIFLGFLATSCFFAYMCLEKDNYLLLALLPFLSLLWGAISYDEIFRILESKGESGGSI